MNKADALTRLHAVLLMGLLGFVLRRGLGLGLLELAIPRARMLSIAVLPPRPSQLQTPVSRHEHWRQSAASARQAALPAA